MQGILRGLDQMTNLIMAECQERVFSSKVRAGSALLQPKAPENVADSTRYMHLHR